MPVYLGHFKFEGQPIRRFIFAENSHLARVQGRQLKFELGMELSFCQLVDKFSLHYFIEELGGRITEVQGDLNYGASPDPITLTTDNALEALMFLLSIVEDSFWLSLVPTDRINACGERITRSSVPKVQLPRAIKQTVPA